MTGLKSLPRRKIIPKIRSTRFRTIPLDSGFRIVQRPLDFSGSPQKMHSHVSHFLPSMFRISLVWIQIGEVAAGASAVTAENAGRSEWLRIPPISREARKVYDRKVDIYQEVHEEILALERSVTRDRRTMDGIQRRLDQASPDARKRLEREATGIEVRLFSSEAQLDARRAEYADLRQPDLEFMPITIELGITEERSEKRAVHALADLLEYNSERIAEAAADRIEDEIDRSFATTADGPQDIDRDLETARANYFDALVAFNTSSTETADKRGKTENVLTQAKSEYNALRASAGLEPID